MPLRCVYTDLDGTLLGPMASLFRGPSGEFSMRQARALEACHRAGVEVVIMTGRREAQAISDSRLMGQTSYIYESGCAVAIDGERTYLTGEWQPDESGTPVERMHTAGIPQLLFAEFAPRLEWHAPWHEGRELSLLMRGKVDAEAANYLLRQNGHDGLRFLDNGAIGRRMEAVEGKVHAYHLVPGGASKAKGVEFHMRAKGYGPAECIAVGDSIEDVETASVVGQFFCVANGAEHDAGVRSALGRFANARVTEGAMGDGFYEAVVTSLMEP